MNLPVLIGVGVAALVLIVVLIRRNAADLKEYEKSENDFSSLPETEADEESED